MRWELVLFTLGHRFHCAQLVEVLHVDAQLKIGRDFRISGRHLLLVAIQIEVQWIGRTHIVPGYVRVIHRQFAEAQSISLIGHIVPVRHLGAGLGIGAAECLDDRIFLDAHRRHFAVDMRRRQELLEVQKQIVFFRFYPGDLPDLIRLAMPIPKASISPLTGTCKAFTFSLCRRILPSGVGLITPCVSKGMSPLSWSRPFTLSCPLAVVLTEMPDSGEFGRAKTYEFNRLARSAGLIAISAVSMRIFE
jgi:hypothetical protein